MAATNTTFSSSNLKFIDDDDFQDYPSPCFSSTPKPTSIIRPFKKPKKLKPTKPIKDNVPPNDPDPDLGSGLDSIEPTLDFLNQKLSLGDDSVELESMKPRFDYGDDEEEVEGEKEEGDEGNTQLDVLLELCEGEDELEEECVGEVSCPLCGADISGLSEDMRQIHTNQCNVDDESEVECVGRVSCPLCGADISGLSEDMRQVHTNRCIDEMEASTNAETTEEVSGVYQCPGQVDDVSPLKSCKKVVDGSPVVEWLRKLGLSKYEEIFVREEIDWDALQWLKEEDLCNIGITALGPRKKIVHALIELRNDSAMIGVAKADVPKDVAGVADETKPGTNKLITDFFSGPPSERKKSVVTANQQKTRKSPADATTRKNIQGKNRARNGKLKDVPLWCRIPGTEFRVDAFKYLRRDCSHWFLTHFHLDHYQGLTKSFGHGMIYCSSITAKLVNMKIGIPWDKIQVLPLNQKINIAGTDVTCFDANHCPGAIIILFEPPSGKPVLHTGDFRFCEEIGKLSALQECRIHTLILDTTYCNPQYDFPKQEAIIQFVIDAVQAETFNPKTLFLIGSYTIGKERVFIEVARALRKKVYVTTTKLRILECLDLPQEDMQWFTSNEQESHIHVVPMWSIASFKRLKHVSNQYMGRYSLIIAISPTGWSFGKGKKSTGRRSQQGTIIRYDVPYSEHSSFSELRECVKFISPASIIPSVNNHGPDSQNSMVAQLLA